MWLGAVVDLPHLLDVGITTLPTAFDYLTMRPWIAQISLICVC